MDDDERASEERREILLMDMKTCQSERFISQLALLRHLLVAEYNYRTCAMPLVPQRLDR
jgi:hypothetical protein